ncbi:hypothetical protein PTKIN_Ptkin07bG0016700 [Pterospermum kingtungense]
MGFGSKYISPPSDLTSVDMNNENHQRHVTAWLVYAVKALELDRQKGLSRAPEYWTPLQFKLILVLDDEDGSIFGAIFEYKPKTPASHGSPSYYVFAFRGTLLKCGSFKRDLELDWDIFRNSPHDSRFETAIDIVREVVANVGDTDMIWLTGHSLGAAIAMLAGKTMAKEGKILKTFLFNPPYVSIPVEKVIKSKIARGALRCAGTAAKLAFAFIGVIGNNESEYEDLFADLSRWVPNVFVNPGDVICCGYISYFKQRKKLEDFGFRCIANATSHHSLGNKAMKAVGLTKGSKPLHLLPSANLFVNESRSKDHRSHELRQWLRLRPDDHLDLTSITCRYT